VWCINFYHKFIKWRRPYRRKEEEKKRRREEEKRKRKESVGDQGQGRSTRRSTLRVQSSDGQAVELDVDEVSLQSC
jgi:hypothetical protein